MLRSFVKLKKVRVVTLDVTGTLLIHSQSVNQTYAECVAWAKVDSPPTAADLKKPFKDAYKHALLTYPCFGHGNNMPGRDWWWRLAQDCLSRAGINLSSSQFEIFFQRLYQHYGSQRGYETLPDALALLQFIKARNAQLPTTERISVGVITNTPTRTIDTILPMLGLHDYIDWYVCCREVGVEKPNTGIFEQAHKRAQMWVPGVQKCEMLHIGDNLVTDLCGARAAGYQALFLDRSSNERVSGYQEWLSAPDYEGKCEADIAAHTITSLTEVQSLLDPKLNFETQ